MTIDLPVFVFYRFSSTREQDSMSDQPKLVDGQIDTPLPSPTITLVRNQTAAAAANDPAPDKLTHPRGTICVQGFITDAVLELERIAARVYNKTDDGGDPGQPAYPGDGNATQGVIATDEAVKDTNRYDFFFDAQHGNEVSTARGTGGGYDFNWLVVWVKWHGEEWQFWKNIHVKGKSSNTTECGDG